MTPAVRRAIDQWIMNPPELEEDEPSEYCDSPGPRGCGSCPGCTEWGDMELERRRDRELEER
jgi:hypothetical protein